MKRATPNLFVIGAPKCGTTWLHFWLGMQPEVFMCEKKEPAFFCGFGTRVWTAPYTTGLSRNSVKSLEEYEALFNDSSGYRLRGEGSTDYLWTEISAKRIVKIYGTENLKFLAVIRDPADRAFSEHSHLVREGWEKEDFITSMLKEDKRFEAGWHPLFYHRRRGLYSDGLARYFEIFGKKNVLVLLFEEIRRNPKAAFDKVAKFLKLSVKIPPTGDVINKSGRPVFPLLHKYVHKDSTTKRKLKSLIGKKPTKKLLCLMDRYHLRKVSMSSAERSFAQNFFVRDIYAVERLLEVNLKAWLD